MTDKFCVDCKFHSRENGMYYASTTYCTHPTALSDPDPVTGNIRSCEVRMFRTHRCEGKLWEEKTLTWFQTLLRKIL